MEPEVELTLELHKQLKKDGYRYILIKDVVIDKTTWSLKTVTVTVHKEMPAVFRESCTGIDDAMIVNLLEDPRSNAIVFLRTDNHW